MVSLYHLCTVLQRRHNERDGVSNHGRFDCLLNRLFRRRSKKHQSTASLAFVWGIHRWPVFQIWRQYFFIIQSKFYVSLFGDIQKFVRTLFKSRQGVVFINSDLNCKKPLEIAHHGALHGFNRQLFVQHICETPLGHRRRWSSKWWRHHMHVFRVTGILREIQRVTCGFPLQRPVALSFDVLFDVYLNQQLNSVVRRHGGHVTSL